MERSGKGREGGGRGRERCDEPATGPIRAEGGAGSCVKYSVETRARVQWER